MVKVAEIKQENIILAAIEVFKDKGLEQASMEAISKKAEVSKRTLYKYYPTKESLFSVIIERILSRIPAFDAVSFDPDKSLKEQLTTIAQTATELQCCPDFVTLVRMILSECMRSSDSASIMLGKIQELEKCQGMTKWIEAGIVAGKLNVAHPEIASEQFIGALKSTLFWPQVLLRVPPASEEERKVAIEMAVHQFVSAYQK